MSSEYAQAIEQAKANLADVRERGVEALGSWRELMHELFTPEQIAEAEAEADRMIETANRKKAGRRNRRIA